MLKKVISTNKAPLPIGPYSQAISTPQNLLFVSGQIGINPKNGEMVKNGIADETKHALENLKAILEGAGSSLDNVVKTTIFLLNMEDFEQMNEVYSQYFQNDPPARSTVQVTALPKGASVEIEAIAFV
ncbi:MAG TPA: RidA family protein [candidate division Zixibacteria bacterium]